MIKGIKIEICIGNISDAIRAAKYPIDRIELNSALELGGLSPGAEEIRLLKEKIAIPLCCMCRPRGGDFFYDETEYELMLADAETMLKAGADGIVFGFLDKDGKVDEKRTKRMSELIHSYGKEAIFHKAFDETPDMHEAIETLIGCRIDRILSSGQAVYPKILEGCHKLRDLHERYGEQIQLLPGGGVRIKNIQDVIRISNCGQVHMTSKMTHEGGYLCLDEEQLQKMLEQIASL